MGLIEQINQMKNQGLQDQEIAGKLQEQGVAPTAINDAINQSKIKEAVGNNQMNEELQPLNSRPNSFNQMQQTQESQEYDLPEEENYNVSQPQEEYYADNQETAGGGYNNYSEEYDGYDTNTQSMNTDNFIEIAEQVFAEKTKEMQNQIQEINEFKILSKIKLDHTEERIKRIESVMDKLQMAILEKVGSYGNTLQSIKKEMAMMQDSFGKMSPSLAQKHTTHHPQQHVSKKPSTKKKKIRKK